MWKRPFSAWKDLFLKGELHLTLWYAHGESAVISALLLSMWETLGGEGWFPGHSVWNRTHQFRMKNFLLIFSSFSLGWYNSLHYKLPKALLTAVIKDCYEGGKGALRMYLYSWSQLRQWHTRYFRQRKLLLSTGKKMSHDVKSQKPTAGIWGR